MQQQLALLEQYLTIQRPGYWAQLQAPLTMEAIQALEKKYDRIIPEPVRQLYLWRNGQSDRCYEAFVNNSMFLPLEYVLDTAAELTSMIGFDFEIENWWHTEWWPLFHNGGGDYICYDAAGLFTDQPGQLLVCWHDDNDRSVISPDLVSLITALNQYYAAAPPNNEDEFFTVTPPAGYPKRYRVS